MCTGTRCYDKLGEQLSTVEPRANTQTCALPYAQCALNLDDFVQFRTSHRNCVTFTTLITVQEICTSVTWVAVSGLVEVTSVWTSLEKMRGLDLDRMSMRPGPGNPTFYPAPPRAPSLMGVARPLCNSVEPPRRWAALDWAALLLCATRRHALRPQ